MVNKSGQIKIQQMIFMIVAVFILFVIIGLIALSSKMSNLKKSATELERENALSLVSKLANSPEFYCGNSYGNQKSSCVDFDKAMALKNKIEDYEKFWGVSNIEIRIIPNENILCTDDNYPNCDTLKLISDEITGNSVSNFVSVCYKESNEGDIVNKCEIGQIIVSYEAVQ
jgi:hypothetical protein